ncbi:MAG TPA: PEGA domain-containing protein [Planctomycetota bacterium]|nr:PEGA domain-containing protein [Planctomycetota bacterium]
MSRADNTGMKQITACGLLLTVLFVSGCTSRGLTITSVPPGAEVSINRRVVGVTPIRVGFTHYGTYRIELRKEKHQVLVREEPIKPPVYGYDPMALAADNLVPARLNDEVYLHYVLKPQDESGDKQALSDRDALIERAELARAGTVTHPKTGQQYQVALKREAPKSEFKPDDESQSPIAGADNFRVRPTELELVVKDIKAPQPEGLRLAGELNIQPLSPDKKAIFKDPNEERTTADRPAVIRTPKDEELIFDEPVIAEPKAEDRKADRKKSEKK